MTSQEIKFRGFWNLITKKKKKAGWKFKKSTRAPAASDATK